MRKSRMSLVVLMLGMLVLIILPTTASIASDVETSLPILRGIELTHDQALKTPAGDCPLLYYYDDTCTYGYAWPLPQDSNDWFAVRFTNEETTACTLATVRVKLYRPFMTGTPDLQIAVYDDDGTGLPGTLLATATVSNDSLPPDDFGWAEVDFAPHSFIAGGGSGFHIGITTIGGEGDTLFAITDEGTGPYAGEDRSEAHSPGGIWYTLNDLYGYNYDFMIEAEMCCPLFGSIAGTKFHDEDGNSVWDAGETTMNYVKINLHGVLDAGGVVDLTMQTNAQGDYLFTGLTPGDYWVTEDINYNYPYPPPPGRGWQTYPLTVHHKVDDLLWGDYRTDLNFGNDTICDDNAHETTEKCLHGEDDGFSGPAPSNLSPGFLDYLVVNSYDYITEFDQTADNQWFGHTFEGCWDDGCEVMAATMRIKLHAASSGQTNTDNISLGDYSQGHTVNGRIWGIYLKDLVESVDGIWSPGEVMTVVLDLANLPPNSWLPTNILGALQDGNLDIMVTDETGIDFIEIEVTLCCPDSTGSIQGVKWHDQNWDCIPDPTEPRLAGWQITLNPGGATTLTDALGNYSFTNLPPGTYTVTETQQPGWLQFCPGPQGTSHTVVVGYGQVVTGVDFGNVLGNNVISETDSIHCQVETANDLHITYWSDTPMRISDHYDGPFPNFEFVGSHRAGWKFYYECTWSGFTVNFCEYVEVGVEFLQADSNEIHKEGYWTLDGEKIGNSLPLIGMGVTPPVGPGPLILSLYNDAGTPLTVWGLEIGYSPIVIPIDEMGYEAGQIGSIRSDSIYLESGETWDSVLVPVGIPVSVLAQAYVVSPTGYESYTVIQHQHSTIGSSCCGQYTGGFTGNANCDTDGQRDLSDVTRIIDYVYISKLELCCLENGNVNGDVNDLVNLADITKLIDHVYISKAQTAPCE